MNWYGWKPDVPDYRDHVYTLPRLQRLPSKVDLRRGFPPAFDQGDLGSCTAHAVGAAMQFLHRKQGEEAFMPSRLGLYYMARKIEDCVAVDSGSMIRSGVKAVRRFGIWPEEMQPYVEARFRKAPSKACLAEGQEHQAIAYQRMDGSDLHQLKGRLASGFPFVFGFTVYEGFEGPEIERTGILEMPRRNEAFRGAHAVLAVGYDTTRKAFLIRNSWGPKWGRSGHFWMPYEYIKHPDLAADFWALTKIE